MKRKALFKFYFAVDKLNGALDRIIAAAALHCGETTAESAAQRIYTGEDLSWRVVGLP